MYRYVHSGAVIDVHYIRCLQSRVIKSTITIVVKFNTSTDLASAITAQIRIKCILVTIE